MIKSFILALALGQAALAQAQDAPPLHGAGATSTAEVYATWGAGYARDKRVALQYQAVGSGEGQKRILAREVDFGASDEPLAAADLQKHRLLQFPTMVGAVVPVHNLRGVKAGELRLTGPVLAKIYLGQIRDWNDPEIAALNRTLTLPARRIVRVVREDASGTTRAFVNYLSRQDNWDKKITPALKVDWPGETTAVRGGQNVAATVKATEGAIGYVAYQEVVRQQLAGVQLQNRQGSFVLASERSIQAAVSMSDMAKSGEETASLIDLPGAETWPVTDATFVLIPKAATDAAQAKRLLNFFYWAFSQGDRMASNTGFVPLPTRIQGRLLTRFREVVGPDGKPIEFMGGLPEPAPLRQAVATVRQ